MGEMFLENLVVHTRRGLESVIRDGRHAGGRAYGYRAIAGKPGKLEIDQAEAEIVRRIFCEFVEGKTPREIAAGLNADAIKPPRGKNWNASTINGNAARGHGMLINELYAGRIVWNKVRMIKDPATGRRVPRPNRKDQYRSVDAPHLAIVEEATFKAAQVIKAGRSRQGASQSRKAVRPLSGLLRCGSCGAGMSAIGAQRKGKSHRMQCSAFRESGVCSNGRKVSRPAIETLVFEGLREELANPEAIAEYVRTYNAERRRLAKESGDRGKHLQRRNSELDREIDRLITNIAKGADFDTYPKVNELAAERKRVKAELAQIAAASEIVTVHPAAIERYLADIGRLAEVAAEAAELDEPELARLHTKAPAQRAHCPNSAAPPAQVPRERKPKSAAPSRGRARRNSGAVRPTNKLGNSRPRSPIVSRGYARGQRGDRRRPRQ
jgi:site-specific DNA recombinase